MENEKSVDYQAVLADLKARRDQLDHAIAVLEAVAGQSGGAGMPISAATAKAQASGAPNGEIAPDAFFGLTVLEAAKKYLGMVKKPKSSVEITNALIQGGYLFSTSKPNDTVLVLMKRSDAKGGEIVRVGQGLFGLGEWYPNRPKRKKTATGGAAEVDDAADEDATSST
jgi:hypothetical protein